MYLASPTDFAGTDDIITNLAKEREPGTDIIERRAPKSLVITSNILSLGRGTSSSAS